MHGTTPSIHQNGDFWGIPKIWGFFGGKSPKLPKIFAIPVLKISPIPFWGFSEIKPWKSQKGFWGFIGVRDNLNFWGFLDFYPPKKTQFQGFPKNPHSGEYLVLSHASKYCKEPGVCSLSLVTPSWLVCRELPINHYSSLEYFIKASVLVPSTNRFLWVCPQTTLIFPIPENPRFMGMGTGIQMLKY